MQFQGQSHLLTVAVPDPAISREALQKAFDAAYWHRFEVELPEIRAVLVNLHTAVIGRRPDLSLDRLLAAEPAKAVAGAQKGSRKVWYDAGGWKDTERKRGGEGERGSVRVGLGGGRSWKKKKK